MTMARVAHSASLIGLVSAAAALAISAVNCSSGGVAADGGGDVARAGSGGISGSGGRGGQAGSPNDSGAGGIVDGGGPGGADGGGFAAVLTIFTDHCVLCHDATKLGTPAYPQLSLTAADAYDALVNRPADETCGGTRVVPNDPAASYLIQKLTQDNPCQGVRMPRPFEVLPVAPLPADQIAVISNWIAGGAPR
jgi:hypothetical protein